MTQEWAPIDTAPRDGTGILVYTAERCENCPPDGLGISTARYVDEEHAGGWSAGRLLNGIYLILAHEPTHWRPLPEPPNET